MDTNSTSSIAHYVGITGIQDPAHVHHLIASAERHMVGAKHSHTLMLGCLVSASTTKDGPPVNTHRPDRHVTTRALLREILHASQDLGALGMLHFELHKEWPGTSGDATQVVSLLHSLSKDNLAPPVQLNGVLLPEEIVEIHKESGAPIVFQLRKELSARGESEVLKYLERVAGSISKILMDPSAGSGEKIQLKSALDLCTAIDARFPGAFTYGFAGGLGGAEPQQMAHTTDVVRTLCKELASADFSVDTETRVRIPGTTPGTDVLSLELCERYFAAVQAGLQKGYSGFVPL